MPLYRYAFDANDQLVNVFDLPDKFDDNRDTFTCICCGQGLIAKTAARKRVKHFAHKENQPSCNFETYLHKLAKEAFYETFLLCLREGRPYKVALFHSVRCVVTPTAICPNWDIISYKDLTKDYNSAQLECRDGQFVPDLLLTDSKGVHPKLYIEILVKHSVTDAKIASGVRVIEIKVTSEACVEKIRSASLPSQMLNVFNFVPAPLEDRELSCECDRRPISKPSRVYEARERVSSSLTPLPVVPPATGMKFDEPSVSEAIRRTHFCLRFLVDQYGMPSLTTGFRGDLERLQAMNPGTVIYGRVERCADLPTQGPWRMALTCVTEMEEQGVLPIRHCFLCRHVQTERQVHKSGHSVSLHCSVYGMLCGDRTAMRCRSFRVLSILDSQTRLSFE